MSRLSLPTTTLENIKLVIFDKDGTLIDIHHYWCSMIEFRAEFFLDDIDMSQNKNLYSELIDTMGIDLKTKKMKPEGPVGIKPRDYIMDVALKCIQKYDKSYTLDRIDTIFKRVDEYSQSKLELIVKPLPDLKRVLDDLKSADIKIAIATTDLTKRARLAMGALGFEEYFEIVAGADLVNNAKPSADLVDFILENSDINVKNAVVVGDSIVDLQMAQNANCRFIGVKTGLYGDEFIEKSKYLIKHLKELEVEV